MSNSFVLRPVVALRTTYLLGDAFRAVWQGWLQLGVKRGTKKSRKTRRERAAACRCPVRSSCYCHCTPPLDSLESPRNQIRHPGTQILTPGVAGRRCNIANRYPGGKPFLESSQKASYSHSASRAGLSRRSLALATLPRVQLTAC